MSKTRKAICLLPIGLLCAVFIYPFLHELGHGLVVFLLGAKVVKLQWFPLPSILCRMNSIDATEYSCRNGRDYIPSSTLLINPLQPQILDLVCSFYC